MTPALTGTPNGTVTYTLGGTDAADFSIDASSGVVSMVARDFDAPVDANLDNVYELSITATDTDGNSDSEVWTVSVNAVNDPTTVVDDSATTVEDTAVDIDVLSNDIDVDIKSAVASVTQGTNGATVIINLDGTVKYTPAANFTGDDTFTYTNDESNSGTVTVTAVNADVDNDGVPDAVECPLGPPNCPDTDGVMVRQIIRTPTVIMTELMMPPKARSIPMLMVSRTTWISIVSA